MKASEGGAPARAPRLQKHSVPGDRHDRQAIQNDKILSGVFIPKKYGPSVIRRPIFSDHGGMAIGNKKNDQMLFPFSRISAE